jgi:hypothetical protein
MKTRNFLVSLTLLAVPGYLSATIVYNNGSFNSVDADEISAYQVGEDFNLASAATVNEITFWSLEQTTNIACGGACSGYSGSISWAIETDNSGVPSGTILDSGTASGAGVTRVNTGSTYLGGTVFSDTFNITSFPALAGINYWLVLHNGATLNTPTTFDGFYWATSNGGSPDPYTGQSMFLTGVNAWQDTGNEHAFELLNVAASTPEPGTIALLGAGLVGLAAMRRRRS